MPAAVSGATGPTQEAAATGSGASTDTGNGTGFGGTSPGSVNTFIGNAIGTGSPLPDKTHKLALTEGWFLCIGCVGGYLLANTVVGPFVYGILSIALLYQITNLIEGK